MEQPCSAQKGDDGKKGGDQQGIHPPVTEDEVSDLAGRVPVRLNPCSEEKRLAQVIE